MQFFNDRARPRASDTATLCTRVQQEMKRAAKEEDVALVYAIYMDESVSPYLGDGPMSIGQFLKAYSQLLASTSFHVYEVTAR